MARISTEHFVRLTRRGHTFTTEPVSGPPSERVIGRVGNIDLVRAFWGSEVERAELVVRTFDETVVIAVTSGE